VMFTGGTYEVIHFASPGFRSLQKQCNLTPEEAVVVAQQRRIYLLSQNVSLSQIMRGQIDSPFISDDAMKILMNIALRSRKTRVDTHASRAS
jgi:hypothetical protein